MNKAVKKWADLVLDSGGSVRFESKHDVALRLGALQFEAKMLKESDGLALLQCLQREATHCERAELIRPYRQGGKVYYEVQRWWDLVGYLRMVIYYENIVAEPGGADANPSS